MNKSLLRSLIVLVLTAVVLLAATFGLQGLAVKNAQAKHLQIMQTLLPGSTDFVVEPYTGEDVNVRSVHKADEGFVIETATQGYADEITVLVGVANDGTVTGIVVKEMHETFGLGMNGLTDWQFLAQYLRTSGEAEVGTNVDALTGATVTSKAITRCVNSAVAVVTGADADSGATSWGGYVMKNRNYTSNVVLSVVLGFFLLVCLLLRTYNPMAVLA